MKLPDQDGVDRNPDIFMQGHTGKKIIFFLVGLDEK